MKEIKYESILAKDVQVGDTLNIDTGYRPLDSEDCLVTKIGTIKGLFGDEQLLFSVKTRDGIIGWEVPYFMIYGENKFDTKVTRVKKTD